MVETKLFKSFRVNYTNQIPSKYINLIKSSVLYLEFEDYLFVHAGINFDIEKPLEDEKSLLWTRDMSIEKHKQSKFSSKKIIHGHTPIERNQIIKQFSNIGILNLDNGVYLDKDNFGKLTIADLTTKKIFFI